MDRPAPARTARPGPPGFHRLGFAVSAAGLLIVLAAPLHGQDNERSLFVTVLDEQDVPVSNLSADEFAVAEDGVEREVLRVEPARSPMQVAVLVDTSASAAFAIRDIRNGLERLVPVLAERNDVALVSFGGPPRVLVESTRRLDRLREGIGRIFSFSDSAAYLLDALMETARGFERRESARPVIVVVATEGLDYSRYDARRIQDALEESAVATHVIVLMERANTALRANQFGLPGGVDLYQRDRALAELPEATGGQRHDLLLSTALPDRMGALAELLANQYHLVYSRPSSLIPPESISVRMRRADLTAHGTPVRWTGEGPR